MLIRKAGQRAVLSLLTAVVTTLSVVALGVVIAPAASAAPAPIVIDDFAGHTAGPRTVTALPPPDTSTTSPGTFSESGGLATMTMNGDGNASGGIQLDYTLPHLDLTSQGNNTQFFLVFPSIDRSDAAPGDTAANISISLTGGGTTGTYGIGIGSVAPFNVVLNFSCSPNPACFRPQPDFTDVTHVTVLVMYPLHPDPGNGVLTATLDSINTTPTGGVVPPPATPSITAPVSDPVFGPSGSTVSFPVHFSADGQPATVYSASTAGNLTAGDVDVAGTATGVNHVTVTGSGADYTITVGPLTTTGTVVVSIAAGAAVDTWAQPTSASNTVTVHFALEEPPAFTGAPPPAAVVAVAYSYRFTAGGTPAATYSETGALPAGLTLAADGTLSGTPAVGTGGTYPLTVRATNLAGAVTENVTLTVFEGPAITSASHAVFQVGVAGSFTITTTGFAVPSLTFSTTTLPDGLTLTDNGDGTATISGTPGATAAGSSSVQVTATNQTDSAVQTLTLDVDATPAFTSGTAALFVNGVPGSFTVTTSGFPTPVLTVASGSLPAGLTFTDNGDGTATVSGTADPAAAGATVHLGLAATNRAGEATQQLSISVIAAPTFTSPAAAIFVVGTSGSFTVSTDGAPPAALSVTAGTLPSGLMFTDNGDGTATVSGTPVDGTAGDHVVELSAVVAPLPAVVQTLTVKVKQAPQIISQDNASFQVGVAGTFTVRASGTPTPSFALSGTLPDGLIFVDDGDGTATISGTPSSGTAGTYTVTVNATNDLTDPAQTLTVTVLPAEPTGGTPGPSTGSGGGAGSGAGGSTQAAGLASTGAAVEPALSAGAGLVVFGALLLAAGARRRRPGQARSRHR